MARGLAHHHKGCKDGNASTFAALLRECGSRKSLPEAKRLHKRIARSGLEQNRFLASLLIEAYGKCNAVEEARTLFDKLQNPNSHSWNFMIRIYALHGKSKESFSLFTRMQQLGVPQDKFTFTGALAACSCPAALNDGKNIHLAVQKSGCESDVVVGTALINMYAKCGSLHQACNMLDKMPDRNVVSWTTMINAYTQHGHDKEAFQLYHQMHLEGVFPSMVTCISILDVCASLGNIANVW